KGSNNPSGDKCEELSYQTNNGKRSFSRGDRIVFLENDRDLGVKNGMLGEVIAVAVDVLLCQLQPKDARLDRGEPTGLQLLRWGNEDDDLR
ncbi:hypothetical protein ACC862_37305, partial [Rhizobium ruizarguesonis]